ncbi:hypothetical protein [Erwinia sp. ErVv1]|uniref:hypothetical protein n=1 Tax=Erwinia sp. ErVv1 TaxID=1603299 RepID=UPI00082BEA2A|nr:hypothetical protein [Erwinia sp. ErVv1]
MYSEDLKFYEDDEGIAVDLILKAFGSDEIQCVNLESESPDQKMKDDISYLISHQNEFLQKIQKGVSEYCIKTYNQELPDLKIIKLYVFPDKENEYGFMFSTTIDREHGIGVKLKGENIEKIGSSETAFM